MAKSMAGDMAGRVRMGVVRCCLGWRLLMARCFTRHPSVQGIARCQVRLRSIVRLQVALFWEISHPMPR